MMQKSPRIASGLQSWSRSAVSYEQHYAKCGLFGSGPARAIGAHGAPERTVTVRL